MPRMRIVRADNILALPRDTAVCLGFFDGVHLGHAALLTRACTVAQDRGLIPCAHTFDRAPTSVLSGSAFRELTPLDEKAALMATLGIELLAVSTFSDVMAGMPGRQFFEEILLCKLRARHVVAGFHHRFGSHGDTDANALSALCLEHGVTCDIVPPVRLASGELISSSAIRAALSAGNREKAEAMLGRPLAGIPTGSSLHDGSGGFIA